jgi:general secretion pathway protein D
MSIFSRSKIYALPLSLLAYNFNLNAISSNTTRGPRPTPQADFDGLNKSQNSSGEGPSVQTAKLGDYVELDASIKNEMYGTIDFPNAELKDIIKAISKLTNKNFILDNTIQNRRITIVSPVPVTKEEAYNAFLSAFYMNNLTLVSVGKFLKVIEAKSAIQNNTRVFVGDYAPPNEEIVTVLYTLKHLDAEEIQRFVTDLVPRTSRVNYFPDTNTLVITDTGINLRRVIAVLKSLDVPGYQDQLENIKIYHASAKQIAKLLEDILDAQNGSRSSSARARRRAQKTRGGGLISKIVPDERTNSIVVLANGRGVQELKQLIAKLDTPSIAGSGNIHIYYCKNAVSEQLATTINGLISAQKSSQTNNSDQAPIGTAPTTSFLNRNTSTRTSDGVSLAGNVRVTADKATNSLVVLASSSDYAALKQVLERLDIPRRQVYVEATIMELKATESKEFSAGVNVAGANMGQIAGFIPNTISRNDFGSMVSSPAGLNGLVAGIGAGAKYTISGITVSTITGLIKAIESTAQGQILHQPQILISDNEDSEINITDNIPVPTEEISGGTNPVKAIKYVKEKVKIKLKITPQIGEDNELVKLKVEQAVDDFTPYTQGNQIQVTERTANTTVTARSGDTVVIGGLQKRDTKDQRSKFPLLGDLPLIGWLFKGSKGEEIKTNLVLFLKPRIIKEYRDLLNITQERIDTRIKDGEKLYDPKDRHKNEAQEFKERNKKDLEKDPPRGWGFKKIPNLSTDENIDLEDETNTTNSKKSARSNTNPNNSATLNIPESLEAPSTTPIDESAPPVLDQPMTDFPSEVEGG